LEEEAKAMAKLQKGMVVLVVLGLMAGVWVVPVSAAAGLAGEYIADEQAAGYDTSILEEALANLRAKLDEAQGHHDVAAEILEEGAGFDEEGNVTDPRLARETMRDGRRAMRDAQEGLREAHRDFREAMREYRENKRDR
jgi:hypothetical protein